MEIKQALFTRLLNLYNTDPRNGINIRNVFAPYLSPDEVIEWCGQPSFKSGTTAYHFVFGLFFTCFSLFWAFGVFMSGAGFMSLFALPFIVCGIYVMTGAGDKPVRRNTYYAVTNERCIIICNYKQMSFCDYRYSAMKGVNCVDGSIFLAPINTYMYSRSRRSGSVNGTSMTTNALKINFIDIKEDAPKVCQIISRHIDECN